MLDRVTDGVAELLLWRSAPTVVIGKNQNPWRECDLSWMAEHDVRLARRVSGGGAVYHDEGNLNYALALPRHVYQETLVFDLVLQALATLGVPAEQMNRNSLAVEGRKVSGTAFCYRRQGVLHHGTLLVRADLARLRRALRPPAYAIETKAVPSIPSPVANLSEWAPDLDVDRVGRALMDIFAPGRNAQRFPIDAPITDRAQALRASDWLYEQTPAFTARFDDAGRAPLVAHVEKGRITQMEGAPPDLIASCLGELFDPLAVDPSLSLPADQ